MKTSIDYGNLMHRAMRGLIREVLEDVAEHGLPGDHHFFITFDTTHPDVELAQWLTDRYPTDMTVVMQHWYENLDVGEDGFGGAHSRCGRLTDRPAVRQVHGLMVPRVDSRRCMAHTEPVRQPDS